MWTKVVNSIERSVVCHTTVLFSIHELLVAGLRSRHKAVVNKFIAMWNEIFGVEDTLEYPEDLKNVLQKLRPVTELRLPTFPAKYSEEVCGIALFAESARADIPRSRLRLFGLSTPKMKKRYRRRLCPLLDL